MRKNKDTLHPAIILLSAFLIAHSLCASLPAKEPRKIALLVGISNYTSGRPDVKKSAWSDLSCDKDLREMHDVLILFGFRDEDIKIIKNEEATHKGIVDAFRKYLIDGAAPGDTVVFHYSGHGQQVKDDNGDEIDGKDETIVPFDYISQRASDGEKTNVRDDEIEKMLSELTTKMKNSRGERSGNVTFFFDSCCSGTAIRGTAHTRGRAWDEKLDGPEPKPAGSSRGSNRPEEKSLIKGSDPFQKGYVFISACESNESASEIGDEMGAFTYFLTNTLKSVNRSTDYDYIFRKLSGEMRGSKYSQTPSIEGDVTKKLFSGSVVNSSPFITVEPLRRENEILLELPLGRLHGVTKGSRYAIFKPGSDVKDEKNRIADAEIIELKSCTSRAVIKTQGDLKEDDLTHARAVETAHVYEGQMRLKIEAEGGWVSALKKIPFINTGEKDQDPDLRIFRDNKRGDIILGNAVSGLELLRISEKESSESIAGKIENRLKSEYRWKLLSNLGNDENSSRQCSSLSIEVRPRKILGTVVKSQEGYQIENVKGVEDLKRDSSNGEYIIKDGDIIAFEIQNNSGRPVNITIIDLDTEGNISSIFPHPLAPAELKKQDTIIPGDGIWHRIPTRATEEEQNTVYVSIMNGTGHEMFKIIATDKYVDFSPLIDAQFRSSRGAGEIEALAGKIEGSANPLALLLMSVVDGKRGTTPVFKSDYWGTSTLLVNIRPKEK